MTAARKPRPVRHATPASGPQLDDWERQLFSDIAEPPTPTPKPVQTRLARTHGLADVTQAVAGGAPLALLPFLAQNPRFTRAVEAVAVGQAFYALGKKAQAWHAVRRERRRSVTDEWFVVIDSEDDLYRHGLAIIDAQVKSSQRRLNAFIETDSVWDPQEREWVSTGKVVTFPEEEDARDIVLEGHTISTNVTSESDDTPAARQHEQDKASVYEVPVKFQPELIFRCQTREAQQAVVRALGVEAARVERTKERQPTLMQFGKWGHWDRRSDVPARPVESVIVNDDQVNMIVDDIRRFLEQEDEYVRRGIPWHRGYLLHGPPGTGKTSTVKAVSHALKMDLWYASLSEVSTDTSLQSITNEVRGRSLMLLEDIDAFKVAHERAQKDGGDATGSNHGVSTAGLLNVLDGVTTPHGLITIMTANHPDVMDAALLRPGRIDKQFYFGLPTDETVNRHFTFFYDRAPSVRLYADGRSSAEINEIFISHMHDPEGAEGVLRSDDTDVTQGA